MSTVITLVKLLWPCTKEVKGKTYITQYKKVKKSIAEELFWGS